MRCKSHTKTAECRHGTSRFSNSYLEEAIEDGIDWQHVVNVVMGREQLYSPDNPKPEVPEGYDDLYPKKKRFWRKGLSPPVVDGRRGSWHPLVERVSDPYGLTSLNLYRFGERT